MGQNEQENARVGRSSYLGCISSLSDKVNFSQIKTNLLNCKWSFHWPKQEGMSRNSILIVFVSSTFPGNTIWRIKGCVLQTQEACVYLV